MIIGIGIIAWMLIDQFGAASEDGQRPLDLWWIVRLTAMSLAALTLCLALVWRLAQQFLASVDDVICALERVSMGDLSQRLDESGSVEVQRLASTFNLAVENFARRADDLKQSSLKRLQAAIDLRESRELATAIQETALDSIITIDSRGKILAFNAAAEATFGFKAAQAMGQELAELIVPERLREPYRRGLSHYLESGEGPILGKRVEMPALRAGGEEFPVEVAIVANQLRGSVCFTATIRDLTARKQAEEELARAAMYDKLTGLPNRTLLLDRVQQALVRARRNRGLFALMFLDFDRFKLINDGLGHDVGDALLCEIANRLTTELRCGDSLGRPDSGTSAARMGGDEFVVMLEPIRNADDVLAVADRLLAALARPYRLGPHEVFSTASIGIVVARSDYERAEDLIRDADTAMYEAKRAGKARYSVFDEEMRKRVQRRHLLENELRRAIEGEQFSLAYQPIVSLETGRLKSVEALFRWQHPAHGFISPAEFIPIAEESELILHIGRWVLREATRQMGEWVERLGVAAPPTISINLSRKQFAQSDLADQVHAAAEKVGLPPSRIQLEITEDTFASDVPTAIATMNAIKAAGLSAGHRRLRDRLLVVRVAARVSGRRTQDRPLAADRHRNQQADGGSRACAGHSDKQPRPGDRRRGRGARVRSYHSARAGLPFRPGLLLRPASVARRLLGVRTAAGHGRGQSRPRRITRATLGRTEGSRDERLVRAGPRKDSPAFPVAFPAGL